MNRRISRPLLGVLALFVPLLVAWTILVDNFEGIPLDQTTFSAPTNNQVPVYNSATGKWQAGTSPGGAPTGPAGGVLSGTYPNPGFANIAALSILANATNGSAAPAALAGTANQLPSINSGGTAMAFGLLVDANITSGTISAGSLQTAVQNRLMLTPATIGRIEVDGGANNPPTALGQGTNVQLLQSNGAAANPAFVSISGDATVANGGALTITANAVSVGKMAQLAALSLLGNGTNATANMAAITGTTNQIPAVNNSGAALAFVSVSGDLTFNGSTGAFTIGAGKVTLADLANLAASTLIGRDSTGTGVPEAITLGSGLTMSAGGVLSVSAASSIALKVGGSSIDTAMSTLNLNGTSFAATSQPAGTGNVFLATSGVTNSIIAPGAVTYGKIQNETALTLLGNPTAGAAAPSETAAGTANQIFGVNNAGTAIAPFTVGGDVSFASNNFTVLQASTSFALNGVTSITLAAGETDNFAPGTTVDTVRVTTTNTNVAQITGITGGASGRVLMIQNTSVNDIGFYDQNASSSAANRLALGTTDPVTVSGNQSIVFQYDGTSLLWRRMTSDRLVVTTRTFTANGTYTPRTGLVYAILECWGAGGGSGGVAGGATTIIASGGGGAGGYSRKYVSAATLNGQQTITCSSTGGAGGAAGANAGVAGGNTSVGTLCIANGGSGSVGAGTFPVGAAGGTAGTGDIAATGAPGTMGCNVTAASTNGMSGAGGSTLVGGGGAPANTASGTSTSGIAGTGNGAGGGGAVVNQLAGNVAGSAGSGGLVVITEFSTK